jgi:hypothetical protein
MGHEPDFLESEFYPALGAGRESHLGFVDLAI